MKFLSIAMCILFSLHAFSSETNQTCSQTALDKAALMLAAEGRDTSSLTKRYSGAITGSNMLFSDNKGTLIQQEILETGKNSQGDMWQGRYSVILSVPSCKIIEAFEVL